jgi:hypothetical protein
MLFERLSAKSACINFRGRISEGSQNGNLTNNIRFYIQNIWPSQFQYGSELKQGWSRRKHAQEAAQRAHLAYPIPLAPRRRTYEQ